MLFNRNFADLITFARASTRMRFSSGGVLVQDAANVPSLDYDPITLAARGLLVEESRTNLLLYSEQFDNAAWVKAATTVSANAAAAPDGTVSADKLVVNNAAVMGSSTANGVRQAGIAKAASALPYTITGHFKAAEFNSVHLFISDSGAVANNGSVKFNLANGTISTAAAAGGTFTGASAAITPLPNGWYRCSLTVTTSTETALRGDFWPNDSVATTGDGTSGIYAWGGDLAQGAFRTSYVPTTAAQATRAADSAIISDLSKIGFNASEGTLYAELPVPVSVSSPAAGILSLHDGTSLNRMVAWIGSGSFRVLSTVAGAAQTYSAGVAPVVGTLCKFAFAYRANDFASSLNGAAAVTGTLLGVPAVNALRLGATTPAASSEVLGGQIRAVRYFPRRMTNAELQSLTT